MRFWIVLALAVGSFHSAAYAQQVSEADEVQRLPQADPEPEANETGPSEITDDTPSALPKEGRAAITVKIALEGVGLFNWSRRDGTPAGGLNSGGRVSLDSVVSGRLSGQLEVAVSSKLDFAFDRHGTTTAHRLREAYLGWRPGTGTLLQIGRINLRRGSALGFNPTDFLRTGSAVETASPDPTAVRAGRLGTFLVSAERQFARGAITVAFSPALVSATSIGNPLDLELARTNFRARWLAALDLTSAPGSPQFQLYYDGRQALVGLSGSAAIGDSTVVYGEISAGKLPTLLDEVAGRQSAALRAQMAVGASWSNAALGMTFNLEYHHNDAGLTSGQVQQAIVSGDWPALQVIAAIRQDPVTRSQWFARFYFANCFAQGLDLSAFAVIDPIFRSAVASVSATYNATDRTSFGLFLTHFVGGPRSTYGSQPLVRSIAVQSRMYF